MKVITNSYYKVITECNRLLLQKAAGITKPDRLLLQSVSGIIKSDSYYKVRRNNTERNFWVKIFFD